MNERAALAWCMGGGSGGKPAIELKELVREIGGGNSGEIFGCFGGGMEDPTGFMSTLDVDATLSSETERVLSGRFGGAGGGTPWMLL